MNREKIERALDACYDAVIAPETWPAAMHQLARAVGAAATMLYPVNPADDKSDPRDPDRPLNLSPMSPEYVPLIEEYLRDGWYLNHYRAERAFPLIEAGRQVITEHDLATDDERKTLRTYNEFYLRYGFPGYAMNIVHVDGRLWVVPMMRAAAQGHFTPEDAQRLAGLNPHFARLIRLSDKLALRQAETQLGLLDQLACAALLIDWKGHVLRVNARAEALMGRDLRVCRGVLTADDPHASRALRTLVEQVRAGGRTRTGQPPSRAVMRRPGKGPLIVDALPIAGLAADALGPALALLTITDLAPPRPPPEDVVQGAFGLTAAEARLACRLGAGESLAEAADALGIAKETARGQLKAVFAKTGTHRQGQLVALLARAAAAK